MLGQQAQVVQSNDMMSTHDLQAQAGMLSGLNLQQRKEMFTRITDDTLAGILVVMVPTERQKLLDELTQTHPDSAERVVQYIR